MKSLNIISMQKSHARRESIINHASRTGWKYEIVDGINGNEPGALDHFDLRGGEFQRRWKRAARPGDYGCYASHLSAMERILSTESDYGIIIEDDVVILSGPTDIMDHLMPFDVCYISHELMHNTHKIESRAKEFDVLSFAPIGTQGYAVSVEFAQYFLDHHSAISAPIDEELRAISGLGKHRFIMLRDKIVRPDWGVPTESY